MKDVTTGPGGTTAPGGTTNAAEAPTRRRRFGTRARRAGVKGPGMPPPYPVRGLWSAATETERTQARATATATALLEYWTARRSKAETATLLKVTAVRVWQMSQQALFGMMAGLLKQPRTRGKTPRTAIEGTRPPANHAQESTRLKKELDRAQRLIEVLKELPGSAAGASSSAAAKPAGRPKKTPPKTASSKKARAAPREPKSDGARARTKGRPSDAGADPSRPSSDEAADAGVDRGVRESGG